MSRHEIMPFKMVVERGRLVPATQYDAERLDTWRNGTRVNVTFVRDGGRVMERKWFAILNRAVKECSTPWKTAAEASEAVKLAIGIVNLTKTVGGDFLAYPKSLTELSDPELDDAVGQMIDVIYGVTGVDPSEWRKQVAHIRDEPEASQETGLAGPRARDSDPAHQTATATTALTSGPAIEQEPSSDPAPRSDDAGSGSEAASPPSAAEPSAEADAGDTGEADGPSQSPAHDPAKLSDADLAWLKQTARMLWAATGKGEQELLRGTYDGIRTNHTPADVGKLARDKGMSIYKRCKSVCFGEAAAADVLPEIAMIAGCDTRDVVGGGGNG
jgi:hypothetical protein